MESIMRYECDALPYIDKVKELLNFTFFALK